MRISIEEIKRIVREMTISTDFKVRAILEVEC